MGGRVARHRLAKRLRQSEANRNERDEDPFTYGWPSSIAFALTTRVTPQYGSASPVFPPLPPSFLFPFAKYMQFYIVRPLSCCLATCPFHAVTVFLTVTNPLPAIPSLPLLMNTFLHNVAFTPASNPSHPSLLF